MVDHRSTRASLGALKRIGLGDQPVALLDANDEVCGAALLTNETIRGVADRTPEVVGDRVAQRLVLLPEVHVDGESLHAGERPAIDARDLPSDDELLVRPIERAKPFHTLFSLEPRSFSTTPPRPSPKPSCSWKFFTSR